MQYEGSCHCGQIAFVVEAAEPITDALDCNCSLCRRRGGLLWFGPREALRLLAHYVGDLHQPLQGALRHAQLPRCLGHLAVARQALQRIGHPRIQHHAVVQQGQGIGVVVVLHDLASAMNHADRVLVLKHGRVVEQGAVDRVLDQPQAAYTRTLLENSPTLGR